MALGDSELRFAWQAWRLETSNCVLRATSTLRDRRGTYETGLGLVARSRLARVDIDLRFVLSRAPPPHTHNFVTHHLHLFPPPSVTHHLEMMRLCVLGANARFPTEHDSKGHGLMRLAGHALGLWPVSSRPCDCQTSRLGFHRATWKAIFPHTAVGDTPPFKVVAYSKSLLIATIFHIHAHTHVCSKSSHSHTHTLLHTHPFTHHLSSHTFFHAQLSHTTLLLFDPTPSPLSMLPVPAHYISCFNFDMIFHTIFSRATLSHTVFHTHLCHTLSFTHNLATHNSSHTTF